MYGVFVFTVLIFIILFILSLEDGFNIMYLWMSMGISLVASMFMLMAGDMLESVIDTTEVSVDTVEILALQDNVSVSDIRYVGTGKDKDSYYYLTKEKQGKHMKKVNIEESYINEISGNELPTLEIIELKASSKIYTWMYGETVVSNKYIFNVPNGTLTTEFEVDLK